MSSFFELIDEIADKLKKSAINSPEVTAHLATMRYDEHEYDDAYFLKKQAPGGMK